MTHSYRLRKTEILRGYRSFNRVLSQRKKVQDSRLRCYYTCERTIPPWSCTVGFAVKNGRKAVTRNAVKRLLRETWRHGKPALNETCRELHIRVNCVLIYSVADGEALSFSDLQRSMSVVQDKLRENLCRAFPN